jgi:hypothetical protein
MENIDDRLNKAIAEKDLSRIRQILSGFITADQGFSKSVLDDKIRYCERMGFSEDELFEEFDGDRFNENSDEWDSAYFTKQRVKFDSNFSRKRLEHLKQVGRKLFLQPEKKPASVRIEGRTRDSTAPSQPLSRMSRHGESSHNAALGGSIVIGGVGAVIGGVVAMANGAAVLSGVLIGGITGAVVGAGVGSVLDNKDA